MIKGFASNKRKLPIDFVAQVTGRDDPMLGEKIIASLFLRRAKLKKPTVMFIGGDSGSGKSHTALRFQQIVCQAIGVDHMKYMDVMNVYTPIQYPEKIDKILYQKEYADIMMMTMHEAREVIKAKDWHSFLAMSVADINAMSRSIKRMATIIVSQFIRDITLDMRYTMNYYGEMEEREGRRVRLFLYGIYKDTRDLHTPKIKKRGLRGILIYPDGSQRIMKPSAIEISKIDKQTAELFDQQDTDAKAIIIRNKVEKLLKHMQKDIGGDEKKITTIVDYYIGNPEFISKIAKQTKKGWKVLPTVKKIHDLTNTEEDLFYKIFNEKMSKTNLIPKEVIFDE